LAKNKKTKNLKIPFLGNLILEAYSNQGDGVRKRDLIYETAVAARDLLKSIR